MNEKPTVYALLKLSTLIVPSLYFASSSVTSTVKLRGSGREEEEEATAASPPATAAAGRLKLTSERATGEARFFSSG